MRKIDTTHRLEQDEIMDDFDLRGEELEKILQDLDTVNKLLGGNKITIDGLKELIQKFPEKKKIKILDVGCGNGSILKEIARYGRKQGFAMELCGIDANEHAIAIARKNCGDFPEIKFRSIDVFSEEFKAMRGDVILCTLTLHHFKDAEVVRLLQSFVEMVSIGIVVNDLRRSKRAYRLFQAFSAVFLRKEIARKDGLTSILRSFKKEDLDSYGKKLPVHDQKIRKKWAFRFQWILIK